MSEIEQKIAENERRKAEIALRLKQLDEHDSFKDSSMDSPPSKSKSRDNDKYRKKDAKIEENHRTSDPKRR